MSECVFCKKEDRKEGLVWEIENFYIRAAVRGAMAPGHVMVISQIHIPCYGAMPLYLDEEYEELTEKCLRVIEKRFSKPILIELGVHGQSINHAHLHFLPRTSDWYDFSQELFSDYIPSGIKTVKGKDIESIRRVFQEDGQYVSIKENNELYICRTKDYKGTFRALREIPARASGRKDLLDWRTVSDSVKEENNKWIQRTVNELQNAFL